MKIYDRERLGMYKLKPCPCCGGDARVELRHDSEMSFAVCLECGLRTDQHFWPENARAVWDKRCTEGAMVLTLDKLFESVYSYEDCHGFAAAWLETKDKAEIQAVLISVGLDHTANWTIYLRNAIDTELRELTPQVIEEYGVTWRVWDKKPTDDDRRLTPWDTL